MIHDVIIDGTSAYNTYGVYVAKGGYKDIPQWPALKSVRANHWQEINGSEPDLSAPKLDSRIVTISFILSGSVRKISDFYAFLGAKPTRSYTFSLLGRTMSLRLVSMPSLRYALAFHAIAVRFAADTPLEGYSYQAPISTLAEDKEILIDYVPLSDYGVSILKGTIDSEGCEPDVKPLLVRNISVNNGATYDANPLINDPNGTLDPEDYETIGGSYEGVTANWKRSKAHGVSTYESRDITLKCFLQAPTATAWRNLDALLYNITKTDVSASDITLAGAHLITLRDLAKSYKFHYKDMAVEEFVCSFGSIWIKFNLTLTLFRRTEPNIVIITRQNVYPVYSGVAIGYIPLVNP